MMSKEYRIAGTVTHRFFATVVVQCNDELEDAIEDAMSSGHYQLEDLVDYLADSMEQVSAPKTFEDYINE
jgi:hypothetical protein